MNGLNGFINAINNGDIKCLSKIVRIKNSFCDILDWQNENDAHYCDIKLNVIFDAPNGNNSHIAEIQFLLKFLLHAKRLGHKYYSVKRRELFINSIYNNVYNINNDYYRYQNKIIALINDNNINELSNQLFLKPHIVLSMFAKGGKSNQDDIPLLYFVGLKQNLKMLELLLNNLFHVQNVLLKIQDKNKSFLKKYFDFATLANSQIISFQSFVKYLYIKPCCKMCIVTGFSGIVS